MHLDDTLTRVSRHRLGAMALAGALALSLYLGTQAVGTLAGGFLADRVDRGETSPFKALAELGPVRFSSPHPGASR